MLHGVFLALVLTSFSYFPNVDDSIYEISNNSISERNGSLLKNNYANNIMYSSDTLMPNRIGQANLAVYRYLWGGA